jgi:hypothetical protein
MNRAAAGESEYLPEARTTEQLMEEYGDKMKELRVTKDDTQRIVNDTDEFHKLQQTLRERRAVTDGTLRLNYHSLIRERIEGMKTLEEESRPKDVTLSPVPEKKMTVQVPVRKGTSMQQQSQFASPQSVTQFVSIDDSNVPSLLVGPSNLAPRCEVEVEAF